MNVLAINGSPKIGRSNSGQVLSIIKKQLGEDVSWNQWCPAEAVRNKTTFDESLLQQADVLLITCPLYVDGLHSTLMRFLEEHHTTLAAATSPQRVFAVVNCGFYEGKQNEYALAMLRHWSEHCGLLWGGGVGIGTGEMIGGLKKIPEKAGIRKPVISALNRIAKAIQSPDGHMKENIYTQHGIPWLMFKLAGEFGWRKVAKKNGLKPKELFARPLLAN